MARETNRAFSPRNATQLVDQRRRESPARTRPRWLPAAPSTPSTAPAFSTIESRHQEVPFRRQEFRDLRRPVRPHDGERRHQPVGAPVRDAGDDEVVARGHAGDLRAIGHGAQRSDRAAACPCRFRCRRRPPPASPNRRPEQVVQRQGPRRDVDAPHVARLARRGCGRTARWRPHG